jgi:uncharacterized metal-binding protein (TIGR02443 family)
MRNDSACPNCYKPDSLEEYTEGGIDLIQCLSCGHIWPFEPDRDDVDNNTFLGA